MILIQMSGVLAEMEIGPEVEQRLVAAAEHYLRCGSRFTSSEYKDMHPVERRALLTAAGNTGVDPVAIMQAIKPPMTDEEKIELVLQDAINGGAG